MFVVEVYAAVRQFVFNDGKSRREAARVFGLSRETVSKMCRFSMPPGYVRQRPAAKPKLGPLIPVIEAILEADRIAPVKQRHTAKRIFERLRDEHGFAGGYTVVKDHVRIERARGRETFVPLAHPPGHAQVDFGEAVGVIGGVRQKIHFFCMDLPQSDACFVKAYPAETTEAFLDGHVSAFEFFGGVPLSILYDNLKIAVAKICGDGKRERTRAFTELVSHYLFKDRFGRPGKGNDKGKVEGLVKYARANFMTPIPISPNYEALNGMLSVRCLARQSDRAGRRTETIGERLAADTAIIRTLPATPLEPCEKGAARVSSTALVRYILRRDNIIALGNSGTGKTHIGLSVGLAACQKGFSAAFKTAAGLVHQLMEARDERRLLKLQRDLAAVKLLIIDELGYVPFSTAGAELLFEVFSQRYERGSTIVTSNLPFEEWTSVFGAERLTGALLDRLTHHVHILSMNGESYRLPPSARRGKPAVTDVDGESAGHVRDGGFAAACGLRQPVALAVQRQDVDMVGQPVEKRTGQALGAEHRRPFLEWKVRSDDGRATFVALAEHLEQKLGAGRRERHIAQFIDDQQLYRGQIALQLQQPSLIAGLHKLMHQTRRRREGNREALLAGRESKAQSDVRLARAGVAERDDVVAAQDIFTAGEFENQHLVEAGDRHEVERIEALHRWKARLANAPFDDPPLPVDEFQFDQSQQIGRVIDPLARGLPGHLVILA